MGDDGTLLARRLHEAGARIWVDAESTDGGQRSFELEPGEVAEFLADPHGWTARQWGVTAADLAEWIEQGHTPRCRGVTAKGWRCRNRFGSEVTPDLYAAMGGWRCHLHG